MRPRRASSSARSARIPEAAVAATAWISVIVPDRCDAWIATGPTARASTPTTTEDRANQFERRRALLLSIRATDGCGRDRAADEAGHGDQREDVRKGLEERGRRAGVLRQPVGERRREAEQQRRAE